MWSCDAQKIFYSHFKLGECDFERLKNYSKTWILGVSESLWEKVAYEGSQNLKLSRDSSEMLVVAMKNAGSRVSYTF